MWPSRCLLSGAVILFLCETNQAEQCESAAIQDNSPARTLLILFEGPEDALANVSSVATAVGNCMSLQSFADKMLRYLSSFGIDVEHIRENPYEAYEGSDYKLSPIYQTPPYYDTIVASSLNGFTKYLNEPIYLTGWDFISKANISEKVAANQILVFALYRFDMYGKEHCVELVTRSPLTLVKGRTVNPFDMSLYHEEWGTGDARGISLRRDKKYILRYTLNFSK